MQRRRRWFAVTACLLWLLGVEVLPDLHLAFHADDHTHGEEGAIHHHAEHDDDAAHAAHHHHGHRVDLREHRLRIERTEAPSVDHAPSAHTAAGVAHRAIALHRPPPPLLEPLPVPRAAWRVEREPEQQLPGAPRARPNARGPPA